jgi:ribosomal-protein-alanine N-acetyltransferase
MSKAFPVYKTGRFLLRHFTESDLENVYLGLSNLQVIKYYGVHFKTMEETRKQLEWFAELEKNETGIWWAVCSPDNSIFYGSVGLYYLNMELNKAELGFWLMPEFWGRGIITESAQLVIEYGFNTMHLKKIEAEVETENEMSKSVLKKLQFVHTGTKKDCEIKNGHYISIDIYMLEV